MANDEKGQIFIESSNGLYQFNGSKYWLIDPNYNKGTLYFYHGKLTNQIEFNKKYIEFSGDWQKNAIWHPFIPGSAPNLISHARDKSGHEFLASNNQIFKVELLNKFQTLQKGYSTRGMSFINNEFYINTYRGIFRNRTRILPHIVFADDLFYQKKDSTILFSTNSNLIKYYPQNGESKIIDLSSLGEKNYISRIIEYKGNIFIGTQKGFIDFKNRKHIGKNLEINDLTIIDNMVFISSTQGVYIYDGKTFQKSEVFLDGLINSIQKIGPNYWLSTNKGLFLYLSNSKNYEKVILNKDFPALECNIVIKDKNGFYWASTSAGLYRFQKINDKIECYFPSIEFNKRSFCNHQDIFYFGSVQGVVSFNPTGFPEYLKNEESLSIWIYFGLAMMILSISCVIFYIRKNKLKTVEQPMSEDYLENVQEKFLLDLGNCILENLITVSVEELIVYAQMNKKAFYRYMDKHFNILPSELIQTIKELKARSLIRENPGIQMEIVAKNVGYSLSHLFLVLKEKEQDLNDKIKILKRIKY
jgi:ligand-binding sensor domain-containing protein